MVRAEPAEPLRWFISSSFALIAQKVNKLTSDVNRAKSSPVRVEAFSAPLQAWGAAALLGGPRQELDLRPGPGGV